MTVVAATKYVSVDELALLAEAGVEVVGENRLQDLEAKRERWGTPARATDHRRSPALADIIGARRARTAERISSGSMPCR